MAPHSGHSTRKLVSRLRMHQSGCRPPKVGPRHGFSGRIPPMRYQASSSQRLTSRARMRLALVMPLGMKARSLPPEISS